MVHGADPGRFVFLERMELGGSGPTVAVKDSIDIAGFPTRMGRLPDRRQDEPA